MKKENIYKTLYCISIFLIILYFIRLGIDYSHYDTYNSSAPFYTYVIERSIEFVLPSIIVFVVGILCKKKYKK